MPENDRYHNDYQSKQKISPNGTIGTGMRRSLTRRFHCDLAALLCRCARHSEDAALGRRLRGAANNKMSSNKSQFMHQFNSSFPGWKSGGFDPCQTPKSYFHE